MIFVSKKRDALARRISCIYISEKRTRDVSGMHKRNHETKMERQMINLSRNWKAKSFDCFNKHCDKPCFHQPRLLGFEINETFRYCSSFQNKNAFTRVNFLFTATNLLFVV